MKHCMCEYQFPWSVKLGEIVILKKKIKKIILMKQNWAFLWTIFQLFLKISYLVLLKMGNARV